MKHRHFPYSSAASALLVTLLVVTASGAVILVGSKGLLSHNRAASTADSALQAYQMALSGIDEGYARYLQEQISPGQVLIGGEYGEGAAANQSSGAAYSLKPLRRGFKKGTNCTVFNDDREATNSSVYDPDCPYYDLAIRRREVVTQNVHSLTLSKRELPRDGAEYTVSLRHYGVGGVLRLDYLGAGSCQYKYGIAGYASLPGVIMVASENDLTLRPSGMDNSSQIRISALTSGSGEVAVSKGFTTIEVTGYAGNLQHTAQLTVRPEDGNDPSFAQTLTLVHSLSPSGSKGY